MKILEVVVESVTTEDVIAKLGKDVLISYTTDVALTGGKKNEHQGRISKITRNLPVKLMGKGDYEQARRAAGEVDFESKPRKWGTRNENGLIEHNSEWYIEFVASGPSESTSYMIDDQPIEKDKIIGLKPTSDQSTDVSPVVLRAVKLKNVISITE